MERVQKASIRVILSDAYTTYEDALKQVKLDTLEERRTQLCMKFAKSCLKNPQMKSLFPENSAGKREKYKVQFARTERLKESAIPYMQRLLNNEYIDL